MAGNNTINDSLMKYHDITLTVEMEYLYDENIRYWKKILKEIGEVGKTPILIVWKH